MWRCTGHDPFDVALYGLRRAAGHSGGMTRTIGTRGDTRGHRFARLRGPEEIVPAGPAAWPVPRRGLPGALGRADAADRPGVMGIPRRDRGRQQALLGL